MSAAGAGHANLVTFLFLVLLAIIGVGITDYSPADAHRHWLLMILICAGIALYGAARHDRGQAARKHLLRLRVQLLHWIILIISVIITLVAIYRERYQAHHR